MSKSTFRRHRERMRAEAAGQTPAATRDAQDQQRLMAAGLWQMRRDLKNIKSRERKIAYKRDKALPQLADYIDGVIAADQGGQDNILATAMVWRFDIGDLSGALKLAAYAMKHGLEAPDQYKRDLVTIVADETADRALEQLAADEPPEGEALDALLSNLQTAGELTTDHDLHDQVMAKLFKAVGYAQRAAGHNEPAVDQLKKALSLNDRIGVKKDIERLEAQIKKSNAD